MVKNHDFLTIFGKNSAKNRKKTPFFHEKCIFFAFFCKKKHSGVRPLFLQNLALPRDTLFDDGNSVETNFCFEGFRQKKKKKKIKKNFYFFFMLKKIFFLHEKKKIFFIRKV